MPDARLRPFLPSYAVLASDPAIWTEPNDWVLPGWAQLWIVFSPKPVEASTRLVSVPLTEVVVFGGTSRVMPVTSPGGAVVVVDISPMSWGRLFGASAEAMRDRVVPLAQFGPASWSEELSTLLASAERADDVKALLDALCLERLPPAHRDEDVIARLTAALADETKPDNLARTAALGVRSSTLVRVALQHFGYGPKVLIRRTRFLRVLAPMLMMDEPPDFAAVPPGYHDVPHFLRDAKQFLGMTPRRFMAMKTPYLRAVLRGRRDVIGAPLPLLDRF